MPEFFQLILSPKKTGDPFKLVRLDARDLSKRNEFILPPMDVLQGTPVDKWILPSHYHPSAPVMALADRRLWLAKAGIAGSSWTIVSQEDEDMRHARHVRFWTFVGNHLWATWFDPIAGFKYRRLP
jgi:hypothetical protein